jgi:hypothetical protein
VNTDLMAFLIHPFQEIDVALRGNDVGTNDEKCGFDVEGSEVIQK